MDESVNCLFWRISNIIEVMHMNVCYIFFCVRILEVRPGEPKTENRQERRNISMDYNIVGSDNFNPSGL